MLRRAWQLWRKLSSRRPAGHGRPAMDAAPELALPAALAQRLRGLPQRVTLCRDLDRQWAELAHGELAAEVATRLRGHLSGCRRCAEVYAALELAVTAPPLPLPNTLAFRLPALGRSRRPLPWSLRDGRYALAASYLATVCLYLLVGNPYTFANETLLRLQQPLSGVLQQVESERDELWQTASAQTEQHLTASRQEVAAYRRALHQRLQRLELQWDELEGQLRQLELEDLTPDRWFQPWKPASPEAPPEPQHQPREQTER